MRPLLTSVIAVALAFSAAAQSAVVHRKLSGPMVSSAVGDVGQFVISPSGDRVVYEAFLRTDAFSTDETARLEVCNSDGSDSMVLTPYLADVFSILWTPDETRVVFVNKPAPFGYYEVYSVPVDGSAPPVLLSGNVVLSSAHENVQLTGDGSRVVYVRENTVSFPDDPVKEIYSVPVDGSAAPRRLSAAPVRGRYATDFLVSGSTVVYRYFTSSYRLYAVPANGSSAPITLTDFFEVDCCAEFFIDASGTRVVMRGSWVSSVPLDGSTDPVHLTSGSVASFRASPVGEEVLYRADHGSSNPSELFLVPVDGSAAPMHVADGPPAFGGEFNEFSPDGAHVVFYVQSAGSWGPVGLYSARVSDGALATLHSTSVRNIQVSPDSARVAFTSSDSRELYSVPVDGSSPAIRITPDFVPGGAMAEYTIAPDSASVLYRADAETDGLVELFEVEIAPSGAPVATRLNPPMAPGGTLDQFRTAPDASFVLYRIDAEADGAVELVRSPGHDVINAPLPTAVTGDALHVDARNGRVVYVADQDVESRFELYGAPSDGSVGPVKLSGSLTNGGDVSLWYSSSPKPFVLSLDGSTVVYQADAEVDGRHELFSARTDGSAAPIKLNGPLTAATDVENYRLSADGTRVVYAADQVDLPDRRLYSVLVQGGAAVSLGRTFGSPDFEITPDSTHVLSDATGELYSIAIDGSTAPKKLSGASTGLREFEGTADGSRAVFIASSGGVRHLFSNAIDGGDLRDLSGGLTAGTVSNFQLTADGTRVVFRGEQLWSVPVDGSSSGVVLNAPVAAGEGLGDDFQISPDGVHVVYSVGNVGTDRLFGVPTDGSAPAVQISPTFFHSLTFAIAPDSANVVVGVGVNVALWSVPITGGTSVILSLEKGDFAFADGGRSLVHVEFDGLKLTPIRGGRSVILGRPSAVEALLVDGDRAIYGAEEDNEGALEVYSSWLQPIEQAPLPPGRPIKH